MSDSYHVYANGVVASDLDDFDALKAAAFEAPAEAYAEHAARSVYRVYANGVVVSDFDDFDALKAASF